MKIGLVIDDSIDSTDGVQQYVKTLGGWLSNSGHDIKYLTSSSKSLPNVYSLTTNLRVKFNGNKLSVPLPASDVKIKKLLVKEKFDVLHIQMPYSPALAGKIIKHALPNTAIVGTFHILPLGRLQAYGNKLLGWIQRKNLKRFDEICFVSPAALKFAKDHYHIAGQVVPNMISVKAWKNNQKTISNRIVFLGRLVPRKGCKELLQVLSLLPENVLDKLELVVVGDGPQRLMLERLASKLGLKVKFNGFVLETDKSKILASADVAVFPSLGGESFGVVLLEAMAARAGVVIAGDNAGYRSVLGDLPQCIIDFKNKTLAANSLMKIINDKHTRNVLYKKQQELVEKYDTDLVGAQITALYKKAILHRRQDVQ